MYCILLRAYLGSQIETFCLKLSKIVILSFYRIIVRENVSCDMGLILSFGRSQEDDSSFAAPKVLRITRVFRNESGKEYTRTEIVRKPLVVETYVRLRQTKVNFNLWSKSAFEGK
jgi:hypothetical protein